MQHIVEGRVLLCWKKSILILKRVLCVFLKINMLSFEKIRLATFSKGQKSTDTLVDFLAF